MQYGIEAKLSALKSNFRSERKRKLLVLPVMMSDVDEVFSEDEVSALLAGVAAPAMEKDCGDDASPSRQNTSAEAKVSCSCRGRCAQKQKKRLRRKRSRVFMSDGRPVVRKLSFLPAIVV